MASRTAQRRQDAQRLRLALGVAERRKAARRRRRNAGLATAVAAALVVAVAIALSGGGSSSGGSGSGGGRLAATGGAVAGAAYVSALVGGIPQHGLVLGDPRAQVRMVEFADLQCPYCDEFATQALPQLIARYVRPGKLSIEFRNLSFIGPDSVRAARVAAGAEQQNRLWNFVELMYFNQGEENTGYATDGYLRRLLAAVPGLDVAAAERVGEGPHGAAELTTANAAASANGIDATPSFLIGRAGAPLQRFEPNALTAGAFTGALDQLIGGRG
jgi:protein-disulfide isomerase